MLPNYMNKSTRKHLIEEFPDFAKVTRRQREILHLKGVQNLPEATPRVIDLSQGLGYANIVNGRMPCVTPGGAKFFTHRVRQMHGMEALQFQGIHLDTARLREYTSKQLLDLAGNAFEASTCAAVSLAVFMFLAVNHRCGLRAGEIPAQAPSTPIIPDSPSCETSDVEDHGGHLRAKDALSLFD